MTVAFTVRAMDAGPVLAQQTVQVGEEVQAPELLQELFSLGTRYTMVAKEHCIFWFSCQPLGFWWVPELIQQVQHVQGQHGQRQ